MRTLSLLSNEVFEGIQSRQDDEIITTFGEQVGKLLNSEGECEKEFETVNLGVDGIKMMDLEGGIGSEFEDAHSKRAAVRNGHMIKSNILKLVYHFRNDAMQAKLAREFRDAANNRQTNDIGAFATVFG